MKEIKILNEGVFNRMQKALGSAFTRRMASEFGTIAVNFSKERFIKKDWFGAVHEAWKPRKRKDRGSLMVRTGTLKRSIRKISTGDHYVIIGSDVPYAKAHNDGENSTKSVYVKAHQRRKTRRAISEKTGKKLKKRINTGDIIQVKSHTRKMNIKLPQRQFMGESRAMELRIQRHLKIEVESALKATK